MADKRERSAALRKAQRAQRSFKEQAIRSREAVPARVPPWQPFWAVGAIVVLAGLIALIWMSQVALTGASVDSLFPSLRRTYPRLAIPASFFLVGGSILFLGEMFRRAAWERRARELLTGGATVIHIRPMHVAIVLVWMLVPLVIWGSLVPLPVALVSRIGSPTVDFLLLSLIYGFLAAGFVGLFVISLVKRLAYRAFRGADVGWAERRFWRVASVQWRIESWFAFFGVGLAGVLPLGAVPRGPIVPDSLWILAVIAIVLSAVALVIASASPRSGYAFGVAESIV